MTLAELLTHDQLLEMERKLLEAQAKAA